MVEAQSLCFEDLAVGMSGSIEKRITDDDIVKFAAVTGDTNPLHLDDEYAEGTMFEGRIAHGMLTASLFSAVLGTKMPGPGCIYMSQSIRFRSPVRPGDVVVATVTVSGIDNEKQRVAFDCSCTLGETVVAEGEALAKVPSRG
ncbi:MAG: (R)-hydratase [Alphaproteobacteria bacterium]|nr:(R)-hydratase [Alphaproteobacteria bacterium]|tara:strand:+ start:153 stop:581 length:429 start_codon:yes stop_codon:yes gene_type:complete